MEPKTYQAHVDEHWDLPFTLEDLNNLDLHQTGPETWHLIHDNVNYQIEVESADFQANIFTLRVNGHRHHVRLEDPYDVLVDRLGLAVHASQAINEITAPMPGLILDIPVQVGQAVQSGEPLVVLEAMKMENIIKSPVDAVVGTIAVVQGDAVDKGSVLLTFAED